MREMTIQEMMDDLDQPDYDFVTSMIKRLRSAAISKHNLRFCLRLLTSEYDEEEE
jgi:hypothetical protein